jgi:hypothetical protein
MKKFIIECLSKDNKLYLYADAEFAALMWREIELDMDAPEQDDDDVMLVKMKCGDLYEVEWLGFEMIEEEKVTRVHMKQTFKTSSRILGLDPSLNYEGWIPAARLSLTEGIQNDIKIIRTQ